MASVLVNGKIELLQQQILDLSGSVNPTLAQVLTNGNETGGQLINAIGGNIACDAMKCISIECAAFPFLTDVAVDTNLVMIDDAEIKYEGNIIIRNNINSLGTDVIIDSIPSAGSSLPNIVSYDVSTNKLYYQPDSIGSQDLSGVLAIGNDAGGQDISNVNNLTINNSLKFSSPDVIIDTIPNIPGPLIANQIAYDTITKKLYVQPLVAVSIDLSSSLYNGNDAGGQNMVNLGDVNLSTNSTLNFSSPLTTPTDWSVNGVYNIDSGTRPYPVMRFSSSKVGGTQQKSLTLQMNDGEAIWSSQWEGNIPQSIRTKQNIYTIDGQGVGASTNILCDTVQIQPNFAPASVLTISGSINATTVTTSGNITCTNGTIINATGDVVSAYSTGMGPYVINSLNYVGNLVTPILNKLGAISVASDISYSTVFYDISLGGVGSPSSWIPDQTAPTDGSDNSWSHTKPAGAPGLGVKINWYPFNRYYPSAPSIGPVPGPYFTKNDLKAVWAVITPLANIATQGAIFFNIFSYDNVNGSSTNFTNRWDYCANNLSLPLTTGTLTLQAGFKYLIYCYDAPKIVATPSNVGTITQSNGQFSSQVTSQLMKDPIDIHTDIPHIGFSAVALNITPTPQPLNPTNIPISGISLSTTSSQLTAVLSFNVHSIGYRVSGGFSNINREYVLQYN